MRTLTLALGVLPLAAILSCGDGSGPSDGAAASVTVSPDGITLTVGGSGDLTADVRDSAGAALSASGVHWSSVNSTVATVASGGAVTGRAVGITSVIAAYGAVADTVSVAVVDQLTLEIVPAAATVPVGGTAQFTLIAKNGAGTVVTTPPALWASANPAVGIVAEGLALGVSPGSTAITATAAGVTSPSATLTVTPAGSGPCDGITMVPQWTVSLSYSYAAGHMNGQNQLVAVDHGGDFTAVLLPAGGQLPAVEWSGSLAGTATMNDQLTTLSSTPNIIEKYVGSGAPVTGLGSTFILSVNTDACTYEIHTTPFLHVTITTIASTTTTEQGDIQLGTLQASDPLGAWRTLGLATLDGSLDAHSIAALAVVQDAYFPYGVGQQLWAGLDLSAADGAATVDYTILPH